MHDCVELERGGTPTALIATDAFAATAARMAAVRGLAALPLAVVTHPCATASPELLREKARGVALRVLEILTAGPSDTR